MVFPCLFSYISATLSKFFNQFYSEVEIEVTMTLWYHDRLFFHMRKLKLREVKSLARTTQLGSGRGQIRTQMLSSLLLGALDLKAVCRAVKENVGPEEQGCSWFMFPLHTAPEAGLERCAYPLFMSRMITWATNWDLCCEDVYLTEKLLFWIHKVWCTKHMCEVK